MDSTQVQKLGEAQLSAGAFNPSILQGRPRLCESLDRAFLFTVLFLEPNETETPGLSDC